MSVENILARLLCLCLYVCVINEAWQPTTCKCISAAGSAAATSPFPALLGSLHFLRFYGLRVSYSFALCSNYMQTALKRILFKQVPEYMQLCRLSPFLSLSQSPPLTSTLIGVRLQFAPPLLFAVYCYFVDFVCLFPLN